MIPPLAVVRQIHPLLACPGRFHDAAIGFDDRLSQERVGLLFPDSQAFVIDHVHQRINVCHLETTQKITSGRGIGNPLRAQNIEVGFVVTE